MGTWPTSCSEPAPASTRPMPRASACCNSGAAALGPGPPFLHWHGADIHYVNPSGGVQPPARPSRRSCQPW
uniref:Plastocyanin-like domain-containing protein n=1 Tax=Macrostomum lignano TaxID=282301 RepID=A0A1I8F7T8_9PLAT